MYTKLSKSLLFKQNIKAYWVCPFAHCRMSSNHLAMLLFAILLLETVTCPLVNQNKVNRFNTKQQQQQVSKSKSVKAQFTLSNMFQWILASLIIIPSSAMMLRSMNLTWKLVLIHQVHAPDQIWMNGFLNEGNHIFILLVAVLLGIIPLALLILYCPPMKSCGKSRFKWIKFISFSVSNNICQILYYNSVQIRNNQ